MQDGVSEDTIVMDEGRNGVVVVTVALAAQEAEMVRLRELDQDEE